MVVAMSHIDRPSEVIIPLKDANPENGLSDPTSEERTPSHNRNSDNNKRNVGRCGLKLSKKNVTIITLIIFFVISISYNIFQLVKIKQLENLKNPKLPLITTPKPPMTTSCSQGWIQNAESCYFFFEKEDTWNSSNNNCSSYGASLLTMDTPEEMAFINKKKAPAEYWIGHQRKNIDEPWNVWFEIKGEGLCATLNDGVVSSTDCDSHRHWICRKILRAV